MFNRSLGTACPLLSWVTAWSLGAGLVSPGVSPAPATTVFLCRERDLSQMNYMYAQYVKNTMQTLNIADVGTDQRFPWTVCICSLVGSMFSVFACHLQHCCFSCCCHRGTAPIPSAIRQRVCSAPPSGMGRRTK